MNQGASPPFAQPPAHAAPTPPGSSSSKTLLILGCMGLVALFMLLAAAVAIVWLWRGSGGSPAGVRHGDNTQYPPATGRASGDSGSAGGELPLTPPPGSKTEVELAETLLSQDVQPSAGRQELRAGDRLAVTLPGGLLEGPARLTVRQARLPAAFLGERGCVLAAFDVALGDMRELPKDVVLQLEHDPPPANMRAWAGYLDPQTGVWTPVRIESTSPSCTRIATAHLSLFGFFYVEVLHDSLSGSYYFLPTPHFHLLAHKDFAPPDFIPAPEVLRELRGLPPKVTRQQFADIQEARKKWFVLELGHILESVWQAYKGAGFTIPTKTVVYFEKAASSHYNVKSGYLVLDSDSTSVGPRYLAELCHDCAHESFHEVQNQYVSFPRMLMARWLIEATAEYAAGRIARPHLIRATNGNILAWWNECERRSPALFAKGRFAASDVWKHDLMGQEISKTFVRKPLSYFSESDGDAHKGHQYALAHFLDFLFRSGRGELNGLWERMLKDGMSLGSLEAYAREGGQALPVVYAKFAAHLLLAPNSPAARENKPPLFALPAPLELHPKLPHMPAVVFASTVVELAGGYTASCWPLRLVKFTDQAGQPRAQKLTVWLQTPPPPGVLVDVYRQRHDALAAGPSSAAGTPQPVGSLSSPPHRLSVEAGEDDVVYVLAVNSAPNFGSVRINAVVYDALFELRATRNANVPRSYSFVVDLTDASVPQGDWVYVWDLGDGAQQTTPIGGADHAYRADGEHVVGVEVRERQGMGLIGSASIRLRVVTLVEPGASSVGTTATPKSGTVKGTQPKSPPKTTKIAEPEIAVSGGQLDGIYRAFKEREFVRTKVSARHEVRFPRGWSWNAGANVWQADIEVWQMTPMRGEDPKTFKPHCASRLLGTTITMEQARQIVKTGKWIGER